MLTPSRKFEQRTIGMGRSRVKGTSGKEDGGGDGESTSNPGLREGSANLALQACSVNDRNASWLASNTPGDSRRGRGAQDEDVQGRAG